MSAAHDDDYIHPRAEWMMAAIDADRKVARLEARLAGVADAARDEHRAAQDARIAMARAGVGSSRRFDSMAAGVAHRIERMARS